MFTQREKIGRIAKHIADLHGEILEQPRKLLAVAHDAVLQLRQRAEPELIECLRQAAAQRRHRVVAKIVLVLQVNSLQQEFQLDVEIAHALPCVEFWVAHSFFPCRYADPFAANAGAATRGTAQRACPRRSAWTRSRPRRLRGNADDRSPWPSPSAQRSADGGNAEYAGFLT